MRLAQNGSRLVRFLTDLTRVDATVSRRSFAERLGELIDLSDSISLSSTHLQLASLPFEPSSLSAEAIRRDFMEVRAALIESVVRSFRPAGGPSKFRLPAVDCSETSGLPDHGPYLRFYSAHQRDMEFRIRNLQDRARIALTGMSPRLARLVALESALDQTLLAQHRQSFSRIPRLLEQRFTFLATRGDTGETLLLQYQRDMQSLLLAEADARLLPVLGLIEAIEEEPSTEYKEA